MTSLTTIDNSTSTLLKGYFPSIAALTAAYPVGGNGWIAFVGNDQYGWDYNLKRWFSLTSSTVDWGTITGTLPSQADLVAYIAAQIAVIDLNKYPVDYISPSQTVTIEQYENYGIWNPLVNDGILTNTGTLIVN